jgi:hypothetical protein
MKRVKNEDINCKPGTKRQKFSSRSTTTDSDFKTNGDSTSHLTEMQRSVIVDHIRLGARIRNVCTIRSILIKEMHRKKFHENRSGMWKPRSIDPFEKLAYHKILFWGLGCIGPYDTFPSMFKSELEDVLKSTYLPLSFEYTQVYYGESYDFDDKQFNDIGSSNNVNPDDWKLDMMTNGVAEYNGRERNVFKSFLNEIHSIMNVIMGIVTDKKVRQLASRFDKKLRGYYMKIDPCCVKCRDSGVAYWSDDVYGSCDCMADSSSVHASSSPAHHSHNILQRPTTS